MSHLVHKSWFLIVLSSERDQGSSGTRLIAGLGGSCSAREWESISKGRSSQGRSFYNRSDKINKEALDYSPTCIINIPESAQTYIIEEAKERRGQTNPCRIPSNSCSYSVLTEVEKDGPCLKCGLHTTSF